MVVHLKFHLLLGKIKEFTFALPVTFMAMMKATYESECIAEVIPPAGHKSFENVLLFVLLYFFWRKQYVFTCIPTS